MPKDLREQVVRYLFALALEVGAAVNAGRKPPGLRLDVDRYSIEVRGEPILLEYTIHQDTREIRIPTLVWIR